MWIFFYILFILTAIAINPMRGVGDIFWIPKEMVFNLFGFCFIGASWISTQPKSITFKNKWLAIILIHCAISFIWYFYLPITNGRPGTPVVWNLWLIRPFINVILSLWIIQTLVEYTDNLARWVDMAKMLCWTAFGFSIYSFIQVLALDPICNSQAVKLFSGFAAITTMGNQNLTGNFLAALSPLCLMFTEKKYKVIYLLCLLAVYLTGSSLSFLACGVGLFFYLLLSKKWKLLSILTAIGFMGFIFILIKMPHYLSDGDRLKMWPQVIGWCKDTALFGKGLGNFASNMYRPLYGRVALSPHSETLQIVHDGGLVLLFFVLMYVFDLIKRIFYTKKNMLIVGFASSFAAFLFICQGNFPMRIAPLALTGIIYVAALEAIMRKGESYE